MIFERFLIAAASACSFVMFQGLIRRIIQPDVNARATLDQIIAHPFFEGYNYDFNPGNK